MGAVFPLLFDLRPNYGGGNEDNAILLQKIPCMHCCTQRPQCVSRPPPTHASTRDSWTLTGKSESIACGVTPPGSWCAQKKTLESPLDCKEIQPVHLKGNQLWIFIGRTDAETPMLWPPDAKNWLIWKDPDAGNDWRWEEKGMTEDEMVGWHHRLNGHKSE